MVRKRAGGTEVRCRGCNALLAMRDGEQVSIRRGDLQATIIGDFVASLVCYRPSCRTLNVIRPPSARASVPGGPAG